MYPVIEIGSQRDLYTHVHSNIFLSSQEIEAQMSIIGQINQMWYMQTVEYYSTFKKEGNPDTWYNLEGS